MQRTVVQKHVVTGGLGFIGKHLVESLTGDVVIVDNMSRVHDTVTAEALMSKCFQQDLREPIEPLLAGMFTDAVVWHLAAVNGTKNFYERPKLVLDVAIKSIMNVVETCNGRIPKRLVIASSSEVYQQPLSIPTLENEPYKIPDPKNPRYSYAFGKMATEIYAHNACQGYDYVIFRPHNFYGPGAGYDHVIPEVVRKIYAASIGLTKKNCDLTLHGTGRETRAFCHVSDGVTAIKLIAEKGLNGEVYHVGTDEEIEIVDLVHAIADVMNINVDVTWNVDAAPVGATSRRCPDIGKLRALGFSPRVSFIDGLKDTVDWCLRDIAPVA